MAPRVVFRSDESKAKLKNAVDKAIEKNDEELPFAREQWEVTHEALDVSEAVKKGKTVIRLRGAARCVATLRRSDTIQVGEHKHLRVARIPEHAAGDDASCCAVLVEEGVDFVARLDLDAGDAVTSPRPRRNHPSRRHSVSTRNIHVVAAASPRPVSAEYPRTWSRRCEPVSRPRSIRATTNCTLYTGTAMTCRDHTRR